MIVVLDANAVIGYSKGNCFDILAGLFTRVLVARSTYDEVVVRGRGKAGSLELEAGVQAGWVEVIDPSQASLDAFGDVKDPDDRSVVALAFELSPDALVTDDVALLRVAQKRGLVVSGVLEILMLAKLGGYLEAVGPVLDRMQAEGFGIPAALYDDVLDQAGER